MNSSNALGFLVLGSLMNAAPALAPSVFAHGPLIADMTSSAIWSHFMGLMVGTIGAGHLLSEALASYRMAIRARAERSASTQGSSRQVAAPSLQTA